MAFLTRIFSISLAVYIFSLVFTQQLPATETSSSDINNIWYVTNQSDTVFIFVHGIFSNSRSAWLNKDSNVYWPDLIKEDPNFEQPSIFLGGYYTELTSGNFGIRDAANQLFSSLNVPIPPEKEPVLSKRNILFIAHSTGGIVVRHMLTRHIDDFKNKKIGLVLIASPSIGSQAAIQLNWLSDFASNQMGSELQWEHPFLEELDKDFKNLVYEKKIPCLKGIEAIENHLIISKLFGLIKYRKTLVEKESGSRYFGEVLKLEETDHFSAVKPYSIKHPAHRELTFFFRSQFVEVCPELENEIIVKNDSNAIDLEKETPSTLDQSVLSHKPIPKEDSVSLVVESLHSGKREVMTFYPDASIDFVSKQAQKILRLRANAEIGAFVPFPLRWVIVQKEALADWENLSLTEQLDTHGLFLVNNEIVRSLSDKDKLSNLKVASNSTIHLFAVQKISEQIRGTSFAASPVIHWWIYGLVLFLLLFLAFVMLFLRRRRH